MGPWVFDFTHTGQVPGIFVEISYNLRVQYPESSDGVYGENDCSNPQNSSTVPGYPYSASVSVQNIDSGMCSLRVFKCTDNFRGRKGSCPGCLASLLLAHSLPHRVEMRILI